MEERQQKSFPITCLKSSIVRSKVTDYQSAFREIVELALFSECFICFTETAGEFSLTLAQESMKRFADLDDVLSPLPEKWKAIRIYEGAEAINETGWAQHLSQPLAEEGIDMLYLSTYHTDIFLVAETDQPRALQLLKRRNAGDSSSGSGSKTSSDASNSLAATTATPTATTTQPASTAEVTHTHSHGKGKSKQQNLKLSDISVDMPIRKGAPLKPQSVNSNCLSVDGYDEILQLISFPRCQLNKLTSEVLKLFIEVGRNDSRIFSFLANDDEVTLIVPRQSPTSATDSASTSNSLNSSSASLSASQGISKTAPFAALAQLQEQYDFLLVNPSLWKAINIEAGVDGFDAKMVNSVAKVLSIQGISLFYHSTCDQDFILVEDFNFDKALSLLKEMIM